jgi:hypothetical protein
MLVYVCMWQTHAHTNKQTLLCVHMMHVYIYIYIHASCAHTDTHTHTRTRTRTHMHVCAFVYMCVCVSEKNGGYLVDPASSHMLVSKIKPCMSKYKLVYTARLRMAH